MKTIKARAATLSERYGPQLASGNIPEDMPMDVLLQWDQTLTDSHGSQLAARIRLFQYASDAHTDCASGQKTSWIPTLEQILAFRQGSLQDVQRDIPDPAHPLPFEELLLPFIAFVAGELNQLKHFSNLLTPEARTKHLQSLLHKLSYVSSRCFYQAFDDFRHRQLPNRTAVYAQFTEEWLADGMVAFFTEYSALARLMICVCEQWISSTRTFLFRLSSDNAEIAAHFNHGQQTGPLVRIQSGITATHCDDGEVYQLTFASGLRLLYKPRSAETDIALAQILNWLNVTGDLLSLPAVPVLNKEDYSWHGYVRHRQCRTLTEVRSYYQRIGQLAALLQVLGSVDYHFDNLRADGPLPYLIDNETVFSPLPGLSPDHTFTGDPILDKGLLLSIARSLFLSDTRQMFYPDAPGISGVFARKDTHLWTRYSHVNTDRMRERQGTLQRTGKNIPRLGKWQINPQDHIEEIAAGYTATLQHIHFQKEEFIDLVNQATDGFSIRVRFLLRPTAAYEQMMHASLAPQYLQDGLTRSLLFERLALLYIRSPAVREAGTYLGRELGMLERFLVPAFSVRTDGKPQKEVSCISLHARAVFEQNIQALSAEFVRCQQKYLTAHFQHGISRTPRSKEPVHPAEDVLGLCARLMRVYTHFYPAQRLHTDGKPEPVDIRDAYSLDGGLAGVLLLHASVQKIAPAYPIPSAEKLLGPLVYDCQQANGLSTSNTCTGLVKGTGSVIWLLTLLSEISGHTMYFEMAKALAIRATEAGHDYTDLSYATGNAGLLLSLLRLRDLHSEENWKPFLINLSSPMVQSCMEPPNDEVHGLFDGTEGVLSVLCVLYRHFPDPWLKHCITTTHQRLAADWDRSDLLSNTSGRVQQWSLHQGLAGWHFVDKCVRSALELDMDAGVVLRRLQAFARVKQTDTDTVMHGIAGRAECILISEYDVLKDQLLTTWRERYRRTGFYQLNPHYLHPGFFSGISGILYQQLRLLFPGALPSALGFF